MNIILKNGTWEFLMPTSGRFLLLSSWEIGILKVLSISLDLR